MQQRMTLNFRSLCLYLQESTMLSLGDTEHQVRTLVLAKGALSSLNCISSFVITASNCLHISLLFGLSYNATTMKSSPLQP